MIHCRLPRRRLSADSIDRRARLRLLTAALLSGLLAVAPSLRAAPDLTGALTLSNAWVRAMPPGQSMVAAYLQITNNGSESITITGVSSDRGMASLHETRVVEGRSSMHPVPTLAVEPGHSVRFQPGGLHVMLMGLDSTPVLGERVSICVLSDAGKSCTEAAVQRGPIDDKNADDDSNGDKGVHHQH